MKSGSKFVLFVALVVALNAPLPTASRTGGSLTESATIVNPNAIGEAKLTFGATCHFSRSANFWLESVGRETARGLTLVRFRIEGATSDRQCPDGSLFLLRPVDYDRLRTIEQENAKWADEQIYRMGGEEAMVKRILSRERK